MFRLNEADARCEALFASALQRSEAPSTSTVAREISRMIGQLGVEGCACRVAQEFGDHPDSARDRMLWARQVVAELPVESPPFGRMAMTRKCAA
jgi:hypothetical protein